MSYALNQYLSDGVAVNFIVTFPYISQSHVEVRVDSVLMTTAVDYTWLNASTIQFVVAPAALKIVEFRRNSNRTARLVDHQDASTLTEATLDRDANQVFFVAQEAMDVAGNAIQLVSDGTYDAVSRKIKNVQDGTQTTDAINKGQLDAAALAPVTPAAGSISNTPAGNIAATTVQAALNELDSEKIDKSIGTAKGDTIAFTGAGAPVRQAVGADGYSLTASSGSANGVGYFPGPMGESGRLTLTSGLPVTPADVTAAATVYFTPYRGNRIELYDGNGWFRYAFAEMSQALNDATKSPAAAILNTNYDLFVWNDAGTLRCTRGPTWNAGAVAGSDTARGTGANSTELELFEGRYVNKNAITNGPAARRGLYVGTIRTDGSVQVNDSAAKRHVWNYLNRRLRYMVRTDPAVNWTYNTNAYRQANANAANQLDIVVGMQEDPIKVDVIAAAVNTAGAAQAVVGIGIDSTTVNSNTFQAAHVNTGYNSPTFSVYRGYPGLGRHTLVWLENGRGAGGVTTFESSDLVTNHIQTGIYAEVWA